MSDITYTHLKKEDIEALQLLHVGIHILSIGSYLNT